VTPEIIVRVDAWLVKAGPQFAALARCWAVYSHELRLADSPEDRAAVSAAMRGVLLAIVRVAWGVPSLRCGHVGKWSEDWDTWQVDNPPGRGHGCCLASTGSTEDEALAAALEGAP
jgi:hypothetical protein